MKVEFYRHALCEKDLTNVTEVLKTLFLTTGPVTNRFEEKFARHIDVENVIGLNSCTAALHLALLAMEIGAGDEVITTPMTFIATATSILHAGARPVLVDVEPHTGLMDVAKVEQAITSRTKAIIPVHLYGSLIDMVALRSVAEKYDLKVIEDCAHCIEGERDGVRPGQLGDVACYSFYATKNLTCGEGGALATKSSQLAEKVKNLRLHGMTKDASTRYTGKYEHWDMTAVGWKYNMNDVQAALLVDQIDRLEDQWLQRKAIKRKYDAAFAGIENLSIPDVPGKSAHHLYTIWVPPENRDGILHKLQESGVGVAVNYRAIHTLKYFKDNFPEYQGSLKIAEEIGRRTITLPLYPGLRDDEIDFVILKVRNIVGKLGES